MEIYEEIEISILASSFLDLFLFPTTSHIKFAGGFIVSVEENGYGISSSNHWRDVLLFQLERYESYKFLCSGRQIENENLALKHWHGNWFMRIKTDLKPFGRVWLKTIFGNNPWETPRINM